MLLASILIVLGAVLMYILVRGFILRYAITQKPCKPSDSGDTHGNCSALGYSKEYRCMADTSKAVGSKDRMKCTFNGLPFNLF